METHTWLKLAIARGASSRAILVAFALTFSILEGASAAPKPRISVARCEAQFVTIEAVEVVESYRMRAGLVRPGPVRTQVQYQQSLDKVADAVRSVRANSKSLETVLYPLSGFDLTAPMVIFPNARTYILIDRNSVVDARDLPELLKSKLELYGGDRNKDWVFWRETGTDVFRNLLASVFAVSPDSKIKRIDFHLDSQDTVSLELRFVDGRDQQEKTVHYWAGQVADLPVEIAKEQYVREPKRDQWWQKKLSELKPTALLVKGSHSVLRVTRYPDSPNRQSLISHILENGGVVVEGASKQSSIFDLDWTREPGSGLASDRALWELTDGDTSFPRAKRSIELQGVPFSYTDRVRVSLFPPRR
jgi:hypothetical protein